VTQKTGDKGRAMVTKIIFLALDTAQKPYSGKVTLANRAIRERPPGSA
jgi:hypothetical protein